MKSLLRIASVGLLVCVALLATPPAVGGQELRGTFVEAESGDAIEGAMVRLVDAGGATAASGLTDSDGTVVLSPETEGRYSVLVERIGFESWESDPFELRSDRVERRRFRISLQPVRLGDLTVEVEERRCRIDPETGRATARIWGEIRKALERERMTREERRVTYRVRSYRRILDGELRVVSEDAATRQSAARSPYRSVPTDVLASEGFARRDGTGWLYRAPDADVLLSESFLQTHCFEIAERRDGGRVGLSFRPVEDRYVPEIQGTMWVDTATAALEEVEFRYTNLGLPVADSIARGRVVFEQLPGGEWYVDRWWIRWPRRVEEGQLRQQGIDETGVRQVRRDRKVVRYGEVGAEVASDVAGGDEAEEPERRTVVGRGTVIGTVYDSLREAPAGGVEVHLHGTGRLARAGPNGEFAFRGVPEGRYRVSFVHPLMPALPDTLTGATVEVDPFSTSDVRLASPGPDRVRRWTCGDAAGGLVLGRVVARDGSEPVPGARVWFDWDEDGGAPSGVAAAAEDAAMQGSVEADSAGRFRVCGVALERPVTVEARGGIDTLRVDGSRRMAAVELRVDPDAAVELADRGSTADGTELVGTVEAMRTGEPLPGARIELLDAERTITAEREGVFRAAGLAPGTQRLVVQHLGYRTDTVRVRLERGTSTFVRLKAETDPVELAGLEVEVERRVEDRQLAGFYRRMESGLGRFASHEQVERHGVLGAVRRMPNVQVRPCYQNRIPIPGCYRLVSADRGHGFGVRAASGATRDCVPDIYLDGIRLGRGDEAAAGSAFEAVRNLPPEEIEGIEIHEPGTAPAQYGGTGGGCGVMLVWTSR